MIPNKQNLHYAQIKPPDTDAWLTVSASKCNQMRRNADITAHVWNTGKDLTAGNKGHCYS